VHFDFSAEQRGARDSLRALLSRELPPSRLRAEWDGTAPRDPVRWRHLAEMGAVGMLVPEALGGMGLDETDMVLLLAESGRHALPDPLVDTAVVAARLLPEALLGDLARGDLRVAVGLRACGRYVAGADAADLLLLEAPDGSVHAVRRADACVTAQPSLDAVRPLCTVEWEPRAATLLGRGDAGEALDRGAFGTAAQLLGLAERTIEMAAAYARSREQFGRPIGSFQAVKHLLADALLGLEFARPPVYRAALSVARDDPDRSRDVSAAFFAAARAATGAGRAALQIHGAIGYTWPHDLHMWLKRATALAACWGGADLHRNRVAALLLGAHRTAHVSA